MYISSSELRLHPHALPLWTPIILPDDLIIEVLSRLQGVCKSWNALIFSPTFIKDHLKKSKRNSHIIGISITLDFPIYLRLDSFPVRGLVENPLICLADDPYCQLKKVKSLRAVGFCNGLLCFNTYLENCLYFWNPATKKLSKILGCNTNRSGYSEFAYGFGYDVSTDTYKVVALSRQMGRDVKVLSLGHDIWRNIQSFSHVCLNSFFDFNGFNGGVYLRGTLNWMIMQNDVAFCLKKDKLEHYIIISLDLGTETYTQFMSPQGFDIMLSGEPTISVLMDCLCFSHDSKGINFVTWKMMKFGVQDSWTQFLKISYANLPMNNFNFTPWRLMALHLYGDILILIDRSGRNSVIYNWKNNKGELATITKQVTITKEKWWLYINNYIESLVSPNGK